MRLFELLEADAAIRETTEESFSIGLILHPVAAPFEDQFDVNAAGRTEVSPHLSKVWKSGEMPNFSDLQKRFDGGVSRENLINILRYLRIAKVDFRRIRSGKSESERDLFTDAQCDALAQGQADDVKSALRG